MRVGLFGNMNNNFFALMRYLRDMGVDAYVLRFTTEPEHFHPRCDTTDEATLRYVIDLDWGRASHLLATPAAKIRKVIDGFDAVVGCGIAPAYFAKAGRKADILIPYGEDVYALPFEAAFAPPFTLSNYRRYRKRAKVAELQSRGYLEAEAVITELNQSGKSLTRMGYRGRLYDIHFPAVYDEIETLAASTAIAASAFGRLFGAMRARSKFVVFHQSRHVWTTYIDDSSWKRNDALIRGFAAFHERNPHAAAALALFEYGPDVGDSKRLISELEIDKAVHWFPISPRNCILYGLANSDVATGEFGLACALNGAVQEGLIAGRPVLHWQGGTTLDAATFGTCYPVIDVSTDEEITRHLQALYDDPAEREAIGRWSRDWYLSVFAKAFFTSFLAEIDAGRHPLSRPDAAQARL